MKQQHSRKRRGICSNPNCRCLKSGFGKQVSSQRPSSASYGFGSAHRDASQKQFLSAEHSRSVGGNNSQGPIYNTYEGIGWQYDSMKQTEPKYGFGTQARLSKQGRYSSPGPGAYRHEGSIGVQKASKRPSSSRATFGTETRDGRNKQFMDEELEKTVTGRDSPAPNSYNNYDSLGKQKLSGKDTNPMWKFGLADRFKYDFITRAKDLPGSGQYNNTQSIGLQSLSPRKTLPKYSFGSCTRDQTQKQFISMEHEKQNHGHNSPGPGTSNMWSAFGYQKKSQKTTLPQWAFGTSKRQKDYITDAPGPGAYCA
eukprot:TRINITY_DN13865_c0_g1_i5.p1 TRINITY_DN13865_c0_g1~~TRINITY_DN13865_c0_g1_i5.p1  ORF type:complete len:311 (-),score=3.85 TRINITY_DN13865_c0_g1_i5:363-1295(-)